MSPVLPEVLGRRAAGLVRRYVLSPTNSFATQRSRMEAAMRTAGAPQGVTLTRTTMAGVPVEVLNPTGVEPIGVLVHVHGGGFTVGSPSTARLWAGAVAAGAGLTAILPDYSLAPEHPFPKALDEVDALVTEILATHEPTRVALSGDSAGANLALGATLDRAERGDRGPAALVLLSPWLDLTVDREHDRELARRDPMLDPRWLAMSAEAYAGGRLDDPRVSPLGRDCSSLPPTLVQGGSDDVLAPDALRLAERAPHAVSLSVAVPLWHDFALQVGTLRSANDALVATIDHLCSTLGHPDPIEPGGT